MVYGPEIYAFRTTLFMVHGSRFMVHGSGFRVQGSGFRVETTGRVHGSWFLPRSPWPERHALEAWACMM